MPVLIPSQRAAISYIVSIPDLVRETMAGDSDCDRERESQPRGLNLSLIGLKRLLSSTRSAVRGIFPDPESIAEKSRAEHFPHWPKGSKMP